MQHLDLQQCQRLQDLGFPQDTYFWYQEIKGSETVLITVNEKVRDTNLIAKAVLSTIQYYACPTLEELIEWLRKETGQGVGTYVFPNGTDATAWLRYRVMDNKLEHGVHLLEATLNLALTIKGNNHE